MTFLLTFTQFLNLRAWFHGRLLDMMRVRQAPPKRQHKFPSLKGNIVGWIVFRRHHSEGQWEAKYIISCVRKKHSRKKFENHWQNFKKRGGSFVAGEFNWGLQNGGESSSPTTHVSQLPFQSEPKFLPEYKIPTTGCWVDTADGRCKFLRFTKPSCVRDLNMQKEAWEQFRRFPSLSPMQWSPGLI